MCYAVRITTLSEWLNLVGLAIYFLCMTEGVFVKKFSNWRWPFKKSSIWLFDWRKGANARVFLACSYLLLGFIAQLFAVLLVRSRLEEELRMCNCRFVVSSSTC